MERRRQVWFQLATFGMALVLSLATAELFLRLYVHRELGGPHHAFTRFIKQTRWERAENVDGGMNLFRKSSVSRLGWEPIPGAQYRHVRINAAGFRGPDYAELPAEGVVRIVVLGDSETFGMALAEEATFCGSLERELARSRANRSFEVLNFGVPGYNTLQELVCLKEKAIRFHPQVVVLYYVFNDPEIADAALLLGRNWSVLSRSYLVLGGLYLYKSARAINTLKAQSDGLADYYVRLHRSHYFDTVTGILEEMAAFLDERGVAFFVVIAPELAGYASIADYPYREVHERFREAATEKLRVIDPLPAITPRWEDPRELWVSPYDTHKNAAANEAIAKYVSASMAAELGWNTGSDGQRSEATVQSR